MKAAPFGTVLDAQGRSKEAPREVELALVLSTVEKHRVKGGGFLRRPAEQVVSVSRHLWPFYLLERKDLHEVALFDGLGLFEHSLTYPTVPQCDQFEAHLKQAMAPEATASAFLETLGRHARGFRDFGAVVSYPVRGWITDQALIFDLQGLSATASLLEATSAATSLAARITPDAATAALNALLLLISESIRQGVQRLEASVNLLASSTSHWKGNLEDRQMEVARQFNRNITDIRRDVERKVQEHREDMRKESAAIEERFARLIASIDGEVSRWAEEEGRYEQKGAASLKSRESAKQGRQAAQRRLSEAMRDQDRELQRVLKYYSDLVEREWQRVQAVQKKRDQEVRDLEGQKQQILQLATQIEGDIQSLTERIQGFASSTTHRAEVEDPWSLRGGIDAVVYVPFFVALLVSHKGARFLVIPPSVIRRAKTLRDRVSSLFGRLILPIQPRTKRFDTVLVKRLQQSLSGDPSLREEVVEKAARNNVLKDPSTKVAYNEGLLYLVEMGWIDTTRATRLIAALPGTRPGGPAP